ncbi:MAG TPA: AMP-binding protein [Kribbella sp.]
MSRADTARRRLLSWLDDPSPGRGLHFAGAQDAWEFWSYQRLAAGVRGVSAALVRSGIVPGDVVAVVADGGPGFVAALFGAMHCGATVSPLPPPTAFGDRELYAQQIEASFRAAEPAIVLVEAPYERVIRDLARRAGVAAIEDLGTFTASSAAPVGGVPGPALVQFTSGSSGRSRAIGISSAALAANVAAIRDWLGMDGSQATASWLPTYHDMGLTGCLITPVVDGSDVWLMSPRQFVRDPLRFLRCFDRGGDQAARHTAMPSFGLAHVAARVRPGDLAGLDFTQVRSVIIGAERIDPDAVRRFTELLGPHGLDAGALLPAYGLAEATLAVTGLRQGRRLRALTFVPSSLSTGLRVQTAGTSGLTLIGCGTPMAGVVVDVEDSEGQTLPAGTVGEIAVSGMSIGSGYLGDLDAATGSLTAFAEGKVRTGDAGFLLDGELFVIGRLGDSLKVRARTVFAEDLEAAIAAEGVPPQRFATALGVREGRSTAVAVIERARPEWLWAADRVLRRSAEGAEVVTVDAPRGRIPRTTSGKPQRARLWQMFGAWQPAGDPAARRPRQLSTGDSDD